MRPTKLLTLNFNDFQFINQCSLFKSENKFMTA